MSDPGAIKEKRLRIRRSAIEAAIEAGRITRERGDELLADDGVPTEASAGIAYYHPVQPDDDRTAPVTLAELVRADGTTKRVALLPQHDIWIVTSDGLEHARVARGPGQYAVACRIGWTLAEGIVRLWLS